MKKLISIMVGVVVGVSLGFADWMPENRLESKDDLNATYVYTNNAVTVQRIASIQTKYIAAATGNLSVNITPKNGNIVEIKISALSAVTSHFVGSDEFKGAYLYYGDVLTITNSCAITNDMSVLLEGAR